MAIGRPVPSVGPSRARAAARLIRPDHVLLILVVLAAGWVMGRVDTVNSGGPLPPTGVVLTVLAIAAVAASAHAVNEYADVETDARTQRTRFSGGSGALLAHGLPASFALRVAVAAGLVAAALMILGLVSGAVSGVVTLMVAVGLIGGWTYSVGPWPWSRHGWGEVANALLGGLLLPATGAVAAGAGFVPAALAFLPFTLLTFVNLLETQWADREADRAVGKHTLASRLSPTAIRRLGLLTVVAAYALSLVVHPWPVALAGLLAAPLSALGVRRLGHGPPGPSVVAMIAVLLLQAAAWLLLV